MPMHCQCNDLFVESELVITFGFPSLVELDKIQDSNVIWMSGKCHFSDVLYYITRHS